MAEITGAIAARIMPTIRFFKIGVNFDMVNETGAAYEYYSPDGFTGASSGTSRIPSTDWNVAQLFSAFDIEVIIYESVVRAIAG